MNLGVLSLILLIAAIILGFTRGANVGVVCLAFSMILGVAFAIPVKDLLAGFSTSIFIQMVGITYLFGIFRVNGTLELIARRMVHLVGKKVHLIPLMFFFIGMLLSAIGPGSIPCLAILPIIAIPVASSAGLNPIMTAIIADFGAMAGRMSPLTPESAVVGELMEKQGLSGNTLPLMFSLMITSALMAVLVFVYYRGWRLESVQSSDQEEMPPLERRNVLSLLGLVILAVGVLFFGWNAGLTGFTVGTVLVILGCGEEKKAIGSIPWGVILMIVGVGILMNIMSVSGGVDLMVAAMEKIMTRRTAVTIIGVLAGFMSFFSSGLGVVFPTLIPTAGSLAAGVGANAVELCASIIIGGTIAGFTPLSVTGALIMAGVSQQPGAQERFPQNRMFVELFAVSIIGLLVQALLSIVGLYGLTILIGA